MSTIIGVNIISQKAFPINSDKIVNKLKLLVALPLIVLCGIALFMIMQFSSNLKHLHKTQLDIQKIQALSHAITQLQKERGLTSGYLENKSDTLYKEVQLQRLKTNKQIETLHCLYENNKKLKKILLLLPLRDKINRGVLSSYDEFTRYTNIIQKLLDQYIFIVSKINNDMIVKEFAPYTSLLVTQESLGELRGAFNAIFAKKHFNAKLFYLAMHAKGQYDTAIQRYKTIAPSPYLKRINKIFASKEYLWVEERINKYLIYRPQIISENPSEWFAKTTYIITQFSELRALHLQEIQQNITTLYNTYVEKIILDIVFLIIIIVSMLFLGLKIKKDILEKISLLRQYRDIVDRSSIVSKTDIYGKITYVNDKFCEISGYTRADLLGKAHNIVRHEDMPKSAFKSMWETIQKKEPWYGIVKNRKKDGSSYTVEVTINPILDEDENIKEYIALRNDITDVINLHQEIEQTQEELILRMGEIGETRSKETGFHVKRVASYSEILAKYYGLEDNDIKNLTIASPMHDIGKVAIPDAILNKPAKLTNEEWNIMKSHAEIGYKLFKNSKRKLLKTAAIIAYEHHEKYDGSGYPQGLAGEDIHIYGRITALADVFDALGSERCYKKAWSDEKIFKLLQEERGKHFDPKLVDIFFTHLDEFLYIRDKYSEKSSFMKES